MRFRKSFKITKGVKLNLSKTGASFTLGTGKGISLNLGTKGAYLNWSIPGTGVYDRVRLDTFVKDKLGSMFGFGKAAAAEEETPMLEEAAAAATAAGAEPVKSVKAAKSPKAKKDPSRPSDEELEAIAQEIALVNIHQMAIEVKPEAEGELDEAAAEKAIEEWLEGSEAPIAFEMQAEAHPEKDAIMIDLDLPEIEDMPVNKLSELADGTIKIKKKTKKEQYADYKTCVFGLGEYVASHALTAVPQAKRIVVSAYTQRRDEKTGDLLDVFIYSVQFDREAFKQGYQEIDPYTFCGDLPSRFYVLASGVMKEITPFEAQDL